MKTQVRWVLGLSLLLVALVVGVLGMRLQIHQPELPPPSAALPSSNRGTVSNPAPDVGIEPTDKARPLPKWFSQQQAGALLSEPLPASSYSLDGISGTVRSADGEHVLKGDWGSFERILIREGESISITLQLPDLRPGREVVVAASNGGRIERRGGPLAFVARSSAEVLDLAFTPTLGRGAYSIDVRHSGAVATLAFWAGPRFPTGEAGPAFTPLPTTSEVIP